MSNYKQWSTKLERRQAFTLIEVLVVIAIIGILVGITVPALNSVRESAKRTKASSDIGQLSVAIATAKDTMSARFVPCEVNFKNTYDTTNAADKATVQDLQQFFGRFGSTSGNTFTSGLPNWGVCGGNQCLVFFLGGYQAGGSYFATGFNDTTSSPFAVVAAGAKRRGPFMDFPGSRLSPDGPYNGSEIPKFLDPWNNPYTYTTTRNGNGDYYGPAAPTTANGGVDANGKAYNFSSFQIRSGGNPINPKPINNW